MKTELERIEEKAGGRLHTVYDHRRVAEKMAAAPGDLTDEEIAVLGFFGGDRDATRARAARERALHPSVEAPAPVAAASAPDDHTMQTICAALLKLFDFTKSMNAKNITRNARLDALETTVAELAARPTAKDAGAWTHGKEYSAGDIVSHGGSGWICRSSHFSTGDEPNHDCFRLFVKRGRDGKDGQTVRQLR